MPIPTATRLSEQPISEEMSFAGGVFVKTMTMPVSGMLVPQHAHSFPHVSVLVKGKIRVWCADVFVADYEAPIGILIKAHVKHTFMALTPAIVLCVHDIESAETVAIDEEHQFLARIAGDAAAGKAARRHQHAPLYFAVFDAVF